LFIKVGEGSDTFANEVFDNGGQVVSHPRNQDTHHRTEYSAIEYNNGIGGYGGGR